MDGHGLLARPGPRTSYQCHFVGTTFPCVTRSGLPNLSAGRSAVASPFLDTLSQKVEINEISTPETPLTAGSVARSVAIALADLFWGS